MLIRGTEISEKILTSLVKRVESLPKPPGLCDLVVGNDVVSNKFVSLKQKAAEKVGINFTRKEFGIDVTTEEIIQFLKTAEKNFSLNGIIVQLPLPPHINREKVLTAIPVRADVDVMGDVAKRNFYSGKADLIPPTAAAIIEILDFLSAEHKVSLQDKFCVVVGRGELVGRPIEYLLKNKGIKVCVINSKTELPEKIMLSADVLISGVGSPGLITKVSVKPGAIIIDAGTAESGGSIKGDVDVESVLPVASFLAGVPGGVGPITVAKLLENVVTVAETEIAE